MAKIIGIDLGTSNSAAAVMEGGRPTIIPSAEGTSIGGKAFPSYVAFTKEGELLVGEPVLGGAHGQPVAERAGHHLQQHQQGHAQASRVSNMAPAMGPPGPM